MIAQRKRKLKEELRSSWFIPLRLAIFLLLFGAVILSEGDKNVILTPFLFYSLSTLLFLAIIQLDSRLVKPIILSAVIFIHFGLELIVEGAVIHGATQLTTQYSVLFLLTIVSASLVYRLMGTLSVATSAAVVYAFTTIIYRFNGKISFFDLGHLKQAYAVSDDVFYAVFLHICTFYLVAFISGFLAEKLSLKEGELTHTSEELERVQLDTDDILLNLHSGLITIDNRGRIVYFNRAAESILGVRRIDIRGRNFLDVFNPRMPEFCERILSVLKLAKPSIRTELELKDKNGVVLPIGLTASVLGDEKVGIRGVVAIFQDLTNAKQLEEALLKADRLAAVGELSARIAHEIRNPLASISGSVEVLQNEIQLEGENARLMELIVKESERLSRILTDFLAYARTSPVRSTKVELVSIVSDTIELLKYSRHFSHQVRISFVPDDTTVYVVADEDLIKHVVINTLSNSYDAVDASKGEISVTITDPPRSDEFSATEWVLLQISDNGCGFNDEDKDRIFEPFFSRKRGGTGLGLAIVKRCLDSLGGRISFESAPGRGTICKVMLKRYLVTRDGDPILPAAAYQTKSLTKS